MNRYIEQIKKLYVRLNDGRSEDNETDILRQEMNEVWELLTPQQQEWASKWGIKYLTLAIDQMPQWEE